MQSNANPEASLFTMQNKVQTSPRVSIGVPTYKRPEMLRRALESIALQDFTDIEVIVGDNDCDSDSGERVVQDFEAHLPNLVYCRHAVNIGGIANFMQCLKVARGEYFTWLADDDEWQSAGYLGSLVRALDSNPDAATAAAKWKLMRSPASGEIQPATHYTSKWWLLRVFKFVWKADDDFFYGLHRTPLLRRASIVDYWPVNAGLVSNLTYTYLIDLVIQGRILRLDDSNHLWVNHAYTTKDHTGETKGRSVNLGYLLKRLNVHWIYATKVKTWGGLLPAMLLTLVSAASLCNEACGLVIIYLTNHLRRARSN
jgi:glycosyltransferase involved in cell wall biosynthesis